MTNLRDKIYEQGKALLREDCNDCCSALANKLFSVICALVPQEFPCSG
jgi:hypothetical protein